MSKPMMRSSPAMAAVRAAPTMPPAGPDRMASLPWKRLRLGQPAVRLHEIQPHALQLGRHLIDIAAQDGREIGVHHRGVAARHQAQQRADRMAGGDLGEPGLRAPVRPGAARAPGYFQACISTIATAAMPRPRAAAKAARARGLVERLEFARRRTSTRPPISTTSSYSIAGRVMARSNRRGPRLVADAQRVGEAAVDHQQRALALALQQRVGGDRGAHLHRLDQPGRDRRVRAQARARRGCRRAPRRGSGRGSRTAACGWTAGRAGRGRRCR